MAEVTAAVVRLSSQGVRKAVASGPEVLRSISLVTGALALGERPKAFRHRQEAAAELRTEIRLTLRKDTTARSQRLGGRASTRAIKCGVFGMAERGEAEQ